MLKTHYRQPIDWRSDELSRSRADLYYFATTLVEMAAENIYRTPDWSLVDSVLLGALKDDLNTPLALARLRELAEKAKHRHADADVFAVNAALLGLQNLDRPRVFTDSFVYSIPEEKQSVYFAVRDDLIRFKNLSSNNILSDAEVYRRRAEAGGISAEMINLGNDHSAYDRGRLQIKLLGEDDVPVEQRIERLIEGPGGCTKSKELGRIRSHPKELDRMGIVLKDNKDGTTNRVPNHEAKQ